MGGARSLAGQVVAFAGRLMTLGRKDAFELVTRFGGAAEPELTERTTMLVVAADGGAAQPAAEAVPPHADPEASRKLRRAAELNARDPGRLRVVSEDEFCSMTGSVTPTALRQQYYALRTIRGLYPDVRDDHLRYLEKWGLLRSVVRTPTEVYYGFADVTVVKQANDELASGLSFRAVLRSLVAAQAGQLALDFRPPRIEAQQAKVVALPARHDRSSKGPSAAGGTREPTTAEAKFLEGERLEASEFSDLHSAMTAYREALRLDPTLVAAMINLGNLHYALDELAEAEALYVHASVEAPDCFEARFNLGNIQHDLRRLGEAARCYGEAVALNPTYADAHFYLAVTLEKLGRSQDARPHWRRYRERAPEGGWVDLAGEFGD